MNLKKVIPSDCIRLHLEGRSKESIIEELVDVLHQAGRITRRKEALKAVLEREKKMTTGMRDGIAIPHGKTDTVDSLVAALGLAPDGVDFEAMDEKPSTIFVLTLSPANRPGPHIQFLGEINRLLLQEEVRNQFAQAGSRDEVHRLLATASPG